jgi:hypothetical protein
VVCGERDQSEFRLPPATGWDPNGPVDSVSRERHRLMEGGESGIHSCSNSGTAGMTGCELRAIRQAQQQGRVAATFGEISIDPRGGGITHRPYRRRRAH